MSQPSSPTSPSEPRGKNLTGEIEVLQAPGQTYAWYIGNGASTDVLKGRCKNCQSFVAIKRFRGSIDDPKTELINKRLIRESEVWLRVKHENVQLYLGHCTGVGPFVALVSPFCKNGSIMEYLSKAPSANRSMLVKDIVKGLHYLHSKNIVHADIHSKNVLVSDDGHAILTDFGRAKILDELGFDTKSLAGCAAYMAPELFPTDDSVDVDVMFSKESDVYAYAMLCQKVLTGGDPFAGYKKKATYDHQIVSLVMRKKRPLRTREIPAEIWIIMERCWVASPGDRPSTERILQLMG